jgi:hypothetical protein
MLTFRRIITIAVFMPLMLAGCAPTPQENVPPVQENKMILQPDTHVVPVPVVVQSAQVADTRSDAELETLLPNATFNQKEFPKPMIISMLRACIDSDNNDKSDRNIVKKAGKVDLYCSCLMEKRVHVFTLSEYLQADSAHWDMKTDPKAVRKGDAVRAECFQRVLN